MKAINDKIKKLAAEAELVKRPEIHQYFAAADFQKIFNSRFIYKPLNEQQRCDNIKKVRVYW
jgi:hypothetical protein